MAVRRVRRISSTVLRGYHAVGVRFELPRSRPHSSRRLSVLEVPHPVSSTLDDGTLEPIVSADKLGFFIEATAARTDGNLRTWRSAAEEFMASGETFLTISNLRKYLVVHPASRGRENPTPLQKSMGKAPFDFEAWTCSNLTCIHPQMWSRLVLSQFLVRGGGLLGVRRHT